MKNQVMQQMAEESDDPDPADEMETLRRIRASVQHVVTEMHQHLSQEIKEVAVKAMPVKSKSMPKVNKREAEVSTTAKDTRRPAEPKVGPKTSRAEFTWSLGRTARTGSHQSRLKGGARYE